MTTRSLTDVFILMRNNAMQSRHFYSEQHVSDRTTLVGGVSDPESGGLELRQNAGNSRGSGNQPPMWADALEEAQYTLSRLRSKVKELEALHSRHLHRPTLDDSSEEEQRIEALTQDISRMFGTAQRLLQQVRQQSGGGKTVGGRADRPGRLSHNVVSALVSALQDVYVAFRRTQTNYLKKLDSREERSRQLLASPLEIPDEPWTLPGSATHAGVDDWEVDSDIDHIDRQFGSSGAMAGSAAASQTQLLLLEEENTRMVEQREKEVQAIVKSIAELNHVFRDLAHMVADQGTILDRIDYNIEQCQAEVHQGYQQLQKASRYQQKNRKLVCIIIMAAVTLVMIILLIVVKS
ncbi:syntaxin-16 [Schistocerca nitens]|uniref:syntaxin-16 n=1 Tax=Schistocerca nitens TaxID=7011 RepID=UPI002119209D|nr:syntaxin-16 [Schistocerca nitens]